MNHKIENAILLGLLGNFTLPFLTYLVIQFSALSLFHGCMPGGYFLVLLAVPAGTVLGSIVGACLPSHSGGDVC